MIKLKENISEWTKDDIIKLRTLLKKVIPLIRFDLVPSDDFIKKIQPYEEIFDKEFYKALLGFVFTDTMNTVKGVTRY